MKKNKTLLFLVLILPIIEPLSFKETPKIDMLYSFFKIINFFIIILLYYNYLRKKNYRINKFVFLVFAFQLELYLSTFLNNGNYKAFFGQTIAVCSAVMLVDMYSDDIKIILKSLISILLLYSIVNIITMIYPNAFGYKESYSFWGMDNRYIFFLLPLCIFSILYSIYTIGKLTKFSYFIIILSAVQLFYTWSVGAMLTIILLMCYVLFYDKIKFLQKISFKSYFIIIILLNMLFVFFQIQYYFEDFLTDVLKKDVTLSGRVYTWNLGIQEFKENIIIGIGGKTANELQDIYYGTNQHAHNLFLNTLVNGGIISFIILMLMFWEINNKLKKCKNRKLSAIMSFSIFLILFLSLADTFDTYICYIVYMLSVYIDKFKIGEKEKYE